ncbi:hypothetical protein [Bdellovibrio reynosensis]|uniref:Uncharacterized protein n=1 Tax=Bdellovibrio reynosensis TaxID=2835041 RepID=A0ABY4CAC9_9BACT|nr:hypothetical protein [Bdellovibrio reynosensis]UOF01927.1 hypothetical protein MNR06_03030 [Bdellovibrio reynosensis]
MALPALKDEAVPEQQKAQSEAPANLFDVGVDKSDLGKPDSFRYRILTWVLDERYDQAIEELRSFLDEPSEYPNFKEKITRFIHHSTDLIYAIKAKRSFPGINSLTRAKQQELREKFKEHFRELQYILKTVEKIQGDLRIQDVRSTIYVVRAAWVAVVAILILGFWLEVFNGLGQTTFIVVDDIFGQFADWITLKIGI